ncbi:uncharacterized protein V6R79_005641 [Siganus canaliculatus]
MARLAALLLLPVLIESVFSISFFLPVNSRKCLREEIHKDVLVTGEYEISEQANTKTNLKITDSSLHTLYSKEDATKGKFAFTTEDYDMFEVCFESKSPMGTGRVPDQLVNLDMKHGVEAKNYEEIAKVEKLKPLEVELRRLEDLSESIVNDFAYMKKREEEMRDTNVYQHACAVLQHILHVLSHRAGYMAGLLPAALLQGKEADRVEQPLAPYLGGKKLPASQRKHIPTSTLFGLASANNSKWGRGAQILVFTAERESIPRLSSENRFTCLFSGREHEKRCREKCTVGHGRRVSSPWHFTFLSALFLNVAAY